MIVVVLISPETTCIAANSSNAFGSALCASTFAKPHLKSSIPETSAIENLTLKKKAGDVPTVK